MAIFLDLDHPPGRPKSHQCGSSHWSRSTAVLYYKPYSVEGLKQLRATSAEFGLHAGCMKFSWQNECICIRTVACRVLPVCSLYTSRAVKLH